MIKRIFIWFFCNLYYFYAKKRSKDSDTVIVTSIGLIMAWPVMIVAMFIVLVLSDFQSNKGVVMLTLIGVLVPFQILFNWMFYKSKRYLTLLEKFPEENYNRLAFYYAIFFCLILPGGILFVVRKMFF